MKNLNAWLLLKKDATGGCSCSIDRALSKRSSFRNPILLTLNLIDYLLKSEDSLGNVKGILFLFLSASPTEVDSTQKVKMVRTLLSGQQGKVVSIYGIGTRLFQHSRSRKKGEKKNCLGF